MADVHAFRGIRYDVGHIGALSDVVAPPYDVISPDLQDQLYKKHPCNAIRLILNRDEPGDDDQNNRYSRAAQFFRNWKRDGVLSAEPDPCLYVYHQVFTYGGVEYCRRGFMGRVRLEPFGEGRIYPHEETHASAKEDRLKLTKACKANLSQIFGIYPDAENSVQNLLEEKIVGANPLEATDHLGVVHRLWPVRDVRTIGEVSKLLGPKPVFVADGHHRYETACNYRNWLKEQNGGQLDSEHPANFVLMMFISMQDPGMIVLPTHRLLTGLPGLTQQALIEKLQGSFLVEPAGEGIEQAGPLWDEIETEGGQDAFAIMTQADKKWSLVHLTDQGREELKQLAAEHSDVWRTLGVAILHTLLLEKKLGRDPHIKPKYVHLVEEVVDGMTNGDPAWGTFDAGILVMPATLGHIEAVSQFGERMPAKSTYFYPKLLSGLVINPVE
ncbi:MAG TPA: DUF1015 domain-containing protein [Pirellulaceae bacterium]|jgi:uncharacterized protein (DUF1015 family)|nr:DUF1015 domain-containing protein [Pirellulaceae bacterium]